MPTINKLFFNALASMSREELIQYLANELTTPQIRNILKKLSEHKKTEILDERLKVMAATIFSSMASISAKITELHEEAERSVRLQKLKGRVMLCRLIQKLASNSGDEKFITESNYNLNSVFMEYKMLGGTEAFYETDSSTLKNLTEEFLLNKYWLAEAQATHKKMGVNSFVKWNIPLIEVKSYLGEEKFEILEQSEEKKKHYFFKDFYISKLRRNNEFIYGIGIDPEGKSIFPILRVVQGVSINK